MTIVTSTRQGDLHPLAYQGLLVYENHYQLTELIRTRLGLSHVLLFAEPMSDPKRQVIDWYCPVQGQITPLNSLPPEEQETIRNQIAQLALDIKGLAEKLKSNSSRSLGGELLELATLYPGDDCIYLVGEQPVLTCWGFGPGTQGAKPEDLTRLTKKNIILPQEAPTSVTRTVEPGIVEPIVAVQSQVTRRPLSWWWLLVLLLLALLLALLFTPLGSYLASYLPLKPVAIIQENNSELALRQQLWERAALCPPATSNNGEPLSIPKPILEETQPEEVKPEDKPKPLIIPNKNQQATQDVQFMEGTWRCDSEIMDETGNILGVEYSFNKQGQGQIQVFIDKKICQASAQAKMQDSNLIIDTQDIIQCPTGNSYSGQNIVCTQKGDKTVCVGQNKNSDMAHWDANFYKIR